MSATRREMYQGKGLWKLQAVLTLSPLLFCTRQRAVNSSPSCPSKTVSMKYFLFIQKSFLFMFSFQVGNIYRCPSINIRRAFFHDYDIPDDPEIDLGPPQSNPNVESLIRSSPPIMCASSPKHKTKVMMISEQPRAVQIPSSSTSTIIVFDGTPSKLIPSRLYLSDSSKPIHIFVASHKAFPTTSVRTSFTSSLLIAGRTNLIRLL